MIIKALSRVLIEKEDYMAVANTNGDVIISENGAILQKSGSQGYITTELINGDLLSPGQIRRGLEINRARQEQIEKRVNSYSFKVFFFSSDLPEDKLEILASDEYNKGMNGSHLCCMSVNLEKKELVKYYDFPRTSYGIDTQIKNLLNKGFDSDYANVDFKELMDKKQKENRIVAKIEKPLLTYVLIAINIVVWLLIEIYARTKGVDGSYFLIDFGAKENTRIMLGEYWRFLTPVFLHNGITHLLVNSYSLYILGITVERLMGRGRFLFIYITAGLMGSIVSFMFSLAPSVGASGAIFGLLGALIYYGIEHPALFRRGFGKSILITLVLNIVYGFSVPQIDNFGHFGGLIGGFLASGVVGTPYSLKPFKKRVAYTVAAVAIVSISLFYGFTNSQNRSMEKLELMTRFFNERNWVESENVGEEIIEIGPKNENILLNALWNLSASEANQGKYNEAVEHAQMLVEVDPANGHYLLGILYTDLGNVEMAKKELEEAVRINPDLRNSIDSILNTLK